MGSPGGPMRRRRTSCFLYRYSSGHRRSGPASGAHRRLLSGEEETEEEEEEETTSSRSSPSTGRLASWPVWTRRTSSRSSSSTAVAWSRLVSLFTIHLVELTSGMVSVFSAIWIDTWVSLRVLLKEFLAFLRDGEPGSRGRFSRLGSHLEI